MILKPEQASIAYRCPVCGEFVHSIVGVFSLSGELIKLKCSCGQSELSIKNSGDRIQLSVPCFVCEKEHIYTISRAALFSEKGFTFTCPFSGMEICFVGNEKNVKAGIKKADEELNEILEENEITDFFAPRDNLDDSIDYAGTALCISVIKDIAAEGRIHCGCTERGKRRKKGKDDILTQMGRYQNNCFGDFVLRYEKGLFVLSCLNCGKKLVLPLSSSSSSMAFDSFLYCDDIYLI